MYGIVDISGLNKLEKAEISDPFNPFRIFLDALEHFRVRLQQHQLCRCCKQIHF